MAEEREQEQKQEAPLLTIFDYLWFHHQILLCNTNPLEPNPLSQPNYQSHNLATSSDSALLLSRPRQNLNTILSGGEDSSPSPTLLPLLQEERQHTRSGGKKKNKKNKKKKKKKKKKSRSMSELEFEELKGFMDLGFTFSGAEADDPSLVSIVPGLQWLGRKDGQEEPAGREGEGAPGVSRPYLSEAWEAAELTRRGGGGDRRRMEVLRNWRIPATGEGVDMKEHLRWWAHAVASAVR